MFESIAAAFPPLLSLFNVGIILFSVFIGITVGALPGLTATMGVALMLPFTFGMHPTSALLMLTGLYCGGIYGGSITAILVRTPGTPAAAATMLDGYPLAKQGRAREALEMALIASVIGGVISVIALLFLAPQLAKVALQFGPPEYTTLAFFGLTIIISVSQGSLVKGLIAGFLGLFLSTVGIDQIDGVLRFSMGTYNLMGGIQLIPALIGLFAVSQVLKSVETIHVRHSDVVSLKESKGLRIREVIRNMKHIVKSSIIGIFIGALPGTGSAIAAFISYNEAKRSSKKKELFGHGSMEGLAAAESANNAVTGATLIPLLTLGVPGDVTTAVMLGAIIIQGLIPGPALFKTNPDVVYGLMIGVFFVNLAMLIIGLIAIKGYSQVVKVPQKLLTPIITVLCIVGAFSMRNTMFDVRIILVFGLIGYFLPKFGFPVTPILIGMILGPMAEGSLRQSLLISDGSWMIFLQRPIAVLFLVLIVVSISLPVIKGIRTGRTMKEGVK